MVVQNLSCQARHQELGSLVVSSGVIIKEMGGSGEADLGVLGLTDLGVEPKIKGVSPKNRWVYKGKLY